MSKRSEFRRLRKNAEKSSQKPDSKVPVKVLYGSQQQVQKDFGVSLHEMKAYLERMEKAIKSDFANEYSEKLYRAESYISVANLLISIYAIKMSRKNREHTKDLVQRMIDNFNIATEFVEKIGVEKAYEMAHKELGVTIEFDSGGINEEFGFPGEWI